jgi:hypothetical protein
VTREAHVDPLLLPELVEGRVQVEVRAHGNLLEEARVAQDPGHVQQQVGRRRPLGQVVVRGAVNLSRVGHQQRGAADAGLLGRLREIGRVLGALQGRAGRLERAGGHLLDEQDVMAEAPQAHHVLEHRPRRATLVRVRRDHARDDDAAHLEKRTRTRTRSRLSVSSQPL